MESAQEISESMRRVAPPGRASLSRDEMARLRELTESLAGAKPGATAEYARFLAIGGRGLNLPVGLLRERLAGKSVLVTGGTGCIGSALLYQLRGLGVASLSSVSRKMTVGWPTIDDAVAYYHADVRDRKWLHSYVRVARPDVIFHCAAQRSPALAEAQVHRTVTTNVLGTRNVLEIAREEGVRQVVLASTGKALRPYSPEIYTASKRAAEWIASREAARGGMLVSGARFTHVLDNSIVHARLLGSARSRGGLMRLHSPDIAFYVQSALESAQLMLAACLGAEPGEFRLHAITDLGWPASLLDVALGVRGRRTTPVYLSGYDPGYEEVPFPGLYDPRTAGDVSPLMNAWEAAALVRPIWTEGIDSFRLRMGSGHDERDLLAILEDICAHTQNATMVRAALDMLSWSLLEAALDAADPVAVARSARLAAAHEEGMPPAHLRVTEALRRRTQGSALVQ
jgi:NAD(P)-dependent dehydrogenase (short-subunit alcohol dehydrogenase family)